MDDVLEYRGFLSRNKHNPSALDIHITPFDIGHILSKNDYIFSKVNLVTKKIILKNLTSSTNTMRKGKTTN
jgi:hypothetical protein